MFLIANKFDLIPLTKTLIPTYSIQYIYSIYTQFLLNNEAICPSKKTPVCSVDTVCRFVVGRQADFAAICFNHHSLLN